MTNVNIKVLETKKEEFFNIWVRLISPFLNLTQQEISIMGAFLYQHYKYSQMCNDKVMIDELTLSTKSREEVKEKLGINDRSLHNSLYLLRRKKLISKDNIINKIIIPTVDLANPEFKLIFDITLK